MKSAQKKFLKSWIEKHANELGINSAKYEYDVASDVHFLEIIPLSILKDKNKNDKLTDLIIEFEETYDNELLCILDQDSITRLERPEVLYHDSFIELDNYAMSGHTFIINKNTFFSYESQNFDSFTWNFLNKTDIEFIFKEDLSKFFELSNSSLPKYNLKLQKQDKAQIFNETEATEAA